MFDLLRLPDGSLVNPKHPGDVARVREKLWDQVDRLERMVARARAAGRDPVGGPRRMLDQKWEALLELERIVA